MAKKRNARNCVLDALDATMAEAMAKTMQTHLRAYFDENATDALKRRQTEQGKTFEGAWDFVYSCWESCNPKDRRNKVGCVPDEVAYGLMMHYMESECEGARFIPLRDFEEAERREKRERADKAKKLRVDHARRVREWAGKSVEEVKRMLEIRDNPYLAHETENQRAKRLADESKRKAKEEEKRIVAEKKAKMIAIQRAIQSQQMTFNF